MYEISEQAAIVLAQLEQEERTLAQKGERTNWILDRQGAEWLAHFIAQNQPKIIVECGTSVGYSTIWMAETVASYGGQVYSIEKDPEKHTRAMQHLTEAGHGEVRLLEGDAELVLKDWPYSKIDLLFLDANKGGYVPQLKAAEPFLAEDAWIIADNVIDMADRLAIFVETMKMDTRYEVRIEEVGDGFLVAYKKSYN